MSVENNGVLLNSTNKNSKGIHLRRVCDGRWELEGIAAFGEIRYNDETGDVVGDELTVVESGAGRYSAVLVPAQGVPEPARVLTGRVGSDGWVGLADELEPGFVLRVKLVPETGTLLVEGQESLHRSCGRWLHGSSCCAKARVP
ncbi:MAG: hypothetical protein JST92_19110 [Deltaproteobacteria bacterium]|nr:hypothetical protein [Deltaproteobacteria bacterium]